MGRRRCRAKAHGHRAGASRSQGPRQSEDETGADGPRRGERSIRATVPRRGARTGTRSHSHQYVWRSDRHRPSAGGERNAHHDPSAAFTAPRETAVWARIGLHRRRTGSGGHRRSLMSDILLTAIGAIALYLFAGLRVLREYERGVYFLLGHLRPTKGPGLIFLPPLLAKMQKVSLRVMAIDIPPQDVITRDNISIKVNAVLYMRVKTPDKAVVGVEHYLYATSQLAQTTLRSVLGETEMDELLANRDKINAILRQIIDKRSEDWGIEVSAVEVKDVDLPPEMKRAMARQAEAERERRAKVINAEGELQAAEKLAQAAHIIGSEPAAIQLRYLQTVNEIASENNSTTIFPIPIDLFRGFMEKIAPPDSGNRSLPERTSGARLPPPVSRNKGKAKV